MNKYLVILTNTTPITPLININVIIFTIHVILINIFRFLSSTLSISKTGKIDIILRKNIIGEKPPVLSKNSIPTYTINLSLTIPKLGSNQPINASIKASKMPMIIHEYTRAVISKTALNGITLRCKYGSKRNIGVTIKADV